MALGLHVTAHHPEGADGAAVLHEKAGNDGVIGLFAKGVIELLHVPLGDGAQHLFAECRCDMPVDAASVALQGAGTKGRLGVGPEPFLHPLAEGHVPLLIQIRAAVAVDGGMELRHQLLLGLREHRFEDRRAVLLVADHDSALPTAILSLAYQPVAVRPFTHPVLPFPFHIAPAPAPRPRR